MRLRSYYAQTERSNRNRTWSRHSKAVFLHLQHTSRLTSHPVHRLSVQFKNHNYLALTEESRIDPIQYVGNQLVNAHATKWTNGRKAQLWGTGELEVCTWRECVCVLFCMCVTGWRELGMKRHNQSMVVAGNAPMHAPMLLQQTESTEKVK